MNHPKVGINILVVIKSPPNKGGYQYSSCHQVSP